MSAEKRHVRDEELARLRRLLAKLDTDLEHQHEMAALPPLTPEQRHIIAWAFRSR